MKILHFKENPTVAFLRSEVLAARQETESLKRQLQHSSLSSSSLDEGAAASGISMIGESVDTNKYHQRLKEAFKQRINLFRDCCYQLTGYMITLSTEREVGRRRKRRPTPTHPPIHKRKRRIYPPTHPPTQFPQVTLRSMYTLNPTPPSPSPHPPTHFQPTAPHPNRLVLLYLPITHPPTHLPTQFPQVTLRSMYAESHDDFLLFQWKGETLEMLETTFTKEKLGKVSPTHPPTHPPTWLNSTRHPPTHPPQTLLDPFRRYNSLPLFLAGIAPSPTHPPTHPPQTLLDILRRYNYLPLFFHPPTHPPTRIFLIRFVAATLSLSSWQASPRSCLNEALCIR